MEIAINSQLYKQASVYAQQQGLSLPSVIENFLVRFIEHSRATTEESVPDVVFSLLGAGEPVKEDDINALEAFQQIRKMAESGQLPELTLDEINEEIRLAREERRLQE